VEEIDDRRHSGRRAIGSGDRDPDPVDEVCIVPAIGTNETARYAIRAHRHFKLRKLALTSFVLAAAALMPRLEASANDAARQARPQAPANVVLISIDTLRADRLGTYGYKKNTSPNIDRLAKQAVVFETAYAQASWTLPSHASMFTGLDPIAHGVTSQKGRLVEAHLTVAEILRDAGYSTAAWVGRGTHSFVGSERGLAQGFDRYEHAPHAEPSLWQALLHAYDPDLKRKHKGSLGEGEAEITKVLEWLASRPPSPFFLFVHLDDVHSQPEGRPYNSPPPYHDRFCPGEVEDYTGCDESGKYCATKMLQRIRHGDVAPPSRDEVAKIECLYDGAVSFTDYQVGRLVKGLRDQRLLDDTLLILTSDHGEAFMEHGETLHFSVYEEVARVPLIVRFPGGKHAGRSDAVVELVDLVPTILEQAAIESPAFLQGQSLRRVVAPKSAAERNTLKNTAFTMGTNTPPPVLWREGTSKLIVRPDDRTDLEAKLPAKELYDLHSDPHEQHNRAAIDTELSDQLQQQLELRRHASKKTFEDLHRNPAAEDVEVPDHERELLKALGYLE
jgi:arylsulfatase A-like enzyme